MNIKYIDKKRFLLENYKKIGLNEQQLVIILLCIGDDVTFKIDYHKIMSCMNIDESNVTNILSDLIKNNIVSVTLKKESSGEITEVIDCSKLFSDISVEQTINVFHEIEKTYGKSLSSKESEIISKWISVNKYSEKDILDAFSVAAINNVKNLKYVEKILESNQLQTEDVVPLEIRYNWMEDE